MTQIPSLDSDPEPIARQVLSARVKEYVQELQMEMRRVTWPSWKQVRATTTVVIVSVFAFAAYFAVVDFLISKGITKIFDVFTK